MGVVTKSSRSRVSTNDLDLGCLFSFRLLCQNNNVEYILHSTVTLLHLTCIISWSLYCLRLRPEKQIKYIYLTCNSPSQTSPNPETYCQVRTQHTHLFIKNSKKAFDKYSLYGFCSDCESLAFYLCKSNTDSVLLLNLVLMNIPQ